MINFDYKEAAPDSDLEFELFTPLSADEPPLIDAVYIPTQAHRSILETQIDVLAKHTKNLILMFSEDAAPWASELTHPNVRIMVGMKQERKDSKYSGLQSGDNVSNTYKPDFDIGFKRNKALLDAAENGYSAICLLDDDIEIDGPKFYKARQALNEGVDMASFHVLDYPDVSTIDHIERIIQSRPSRVSIGGNCLFLKTSSIQAFFPDVYNEDWFFILSHKNTRRVVTLGTAQQRPYQPWHDLNRIASEQFGEILAEGVAQNVGNGRLPFEGDVDYWDGIHGECMERLDDMLSLTREPVFVAGIEKAQSVASAITAADLVRFIDNYQREWTEVFAPDLQSAMNKPVEERIFSNMPAGAFAGAVFGSRAYGAALLHSDYDVIFVTPNESDGEYYFIPEDKLERATNRVCILHKTPEQIIRSIEEVDEDWPVRNGPLVHNRVIYDPQGLFDGYREKIEALSPELFEDAFKEAIYHGFEYVGKIKNNSDPVRTMEASRRLVDKLCKATALANRHIYQDYCNPYPEIRKLSWAPSALLETMEGMAGFRNWDVDKIAKTSLDVWGQYVGEAITIAPQASRPLAFPRQTSLSNKLDISG